MSFSCRFQIAPGSFDCNTVSNLKLEFQGRVPLQHAPNGWVRWEATSKLPRPASSYRRLRHTRGPRYLARLPSCGLRLRQQLRLANRSNFRFALEYIPGVEQPAKDWNEQHDRPRASLPRRNFPLATPKPKDQHQTKTLKKGNVDDLRLAHGAAEIIANNPAQARRAKGTQHGTRSSLRRCVKPASLSTERKVDLQTYLKTVTARRASLWFQRRSGWKRPRLGC